MGSITVTAVTAVDSSPGSQLTISGTWSGLTTAVLYIICEDENGVTQSLPNVVIPLNSNGTFSHTFPTPCACGKDISLELRGFVQDALEVTEKIAAQPLDCNPCTTYCLDFNLAWALHSFLDCKSGRRVVELRLYPVDFEAACSPIPLTIDWGDGTSGSFSATSSAPLSFTHHYPKISSTSSYTITVQQSSDFCSAKTLEIELEPCPDCCPDPGDVKIAADVLAPCTPDCRRPVTVKVDFTGTKKPQCPSSYGVLQASIEDAAGGVVHTFPAVPFGFGSSQSFSWTHPLPSGQTYDVVVDFLIPPQTCSAHRHTFKVEQCEIYPPCPTGLSLQANDLGCAEFGGQCLRKYQFVVQGDFGIGCGSIGRTKLLLDHGDGSSQTIQVGAPGPKTIVLEHFYTSAGSKTPVLTVQDPSGCSPSSVSTTATVKQCEPDDCISCPPPPPPPPWCYCKLCWLFSQKPFKGYCKWLTALIILGIFASNFYELHYGGNWISAAVSTAYLLTVLWGFCGSCCARCAVWPGIIMAVLLSIILWIFGSAPTNGAWLLTLIIMLFVTATLYLLYNKGCKKEEVEELSEENWCKPAD